MATGNEQMRHFTSAARELMERGHVDVSIGRFLQTRALRHAIEA